ncbi:hypothetical protein PVAP13_5KG380707 [Panicum virgatum]|uniref:Uncharacterized protein n=1 Tax=Panicum virgatum TaxID=38727 RepID=A0A8T0ST16_PANVG|nr:hypothetical protein PVAP13_5KG380707 [Panicum virgatum]
MIGRRGRRRCRYLVVPAADDVDTGTGDAAMPLMRCSWDWPESRNRRCRASTSPARTQMATSSVGSVRKVEESVPSAKKGGCEESYRRVPVGAKQFDEFCVGGVPVEFLVCAQ